MSVISSVRWHGLTAEFLSASPPTILKFRFPQALKSKRPCLEEMKGAACSKTRATALNRAKIVNRLIGASAAQLLKDQIGLQAQQHGLAWISLA